MDVLGALLALVKRWFTRWVRSAVAGADDCCSRARPLPVDNDMVEDDHGNGWFKCGPECDMEVVRPGKVQCSCE